jgi:hypothetical protein
MNKIRFLASIIFIVLLSSSMFAVSFPKASASGNGVEAGWMNWGSNFSNSFSFNSASVWSGSPSVPFESLWNQSLPQTYFALSGDLLGTGQLEIVVSSTSQLNVYDNRGKLFWSAHPSEDAQILGGTLGMIDLSNMGGSTVVLATVYSGTQNSNGPCAILIYSGNGTLLKTIHCPNSWAVEETRLADLNNDGSYELIATVYSGYPLSPRGVYVYSYDTCALLWSYQTGPVPHIDCIVDLTNSGKLNVVISTFAPCNGYSAGGTNDDSIYVIALTPEGQVLWNRQLGTGSEQHVRTGAVDINHNGNIEVIAFVRSDPNVDSYGPNDIYELSGSTGSILNKYVGPTGDDWHGFSIVQDSQKSAIFAYAESGKVYAFDENLNKIAETSVEGTPVPFLVVPKDGAANSDGPDIATAKLFSGKGFDVALLVNLPNGTQQVRVFNSDLALLWSLNLPETTSDSYYGMIFFSDLGNGINGIIVAGSPGILVLSPTINTAVSSPIIDISCQSSTTYSNFRVEINGSLIANGEGLSGVPIQLSYSVNGGNSWSDLTLVSTDSNGQFLAVWMPSVTGNYLLKAEWTGNNEYSQVSTIVSFAVTPCGQENVLSVLSNSTLSEISFNSTSKELSFALTGSSGTTGFVTVYVAHSIINDASGLIVRLDGNPIDYTVESQGDSWLVAFSYHHSTHQVSVAFTQFGSQNTVLRGLGWVQIAILVLMSIIVAAVVVVAFKTLNKKRSTK